MNDDEIKLKISDYLKSHRKMTLATVTLDGRPLAHTVEYASDGATVYFGTLRTTRKAQNIIKNSHVSYAVDEDYDDWTKIQGVQIEGRAQLLTEQKDIKQASDLIIRKFPAVADFPPNPDMIFVRIEPVAGFFLDYNKGFAHRDEVKF
ncbi:MAG: pyridoxamine 5'-phosphate oxidase family protein [Nitrospiraceae bacterium]|nr:pyridoxamine 5'-phosphate oxidase family protein [Nitrospiraceae bacterium]